MSLCNPHCDQFQDRIGWLSKFKLPQFGGKVIIHKIPERFLQRSFVIREQTNAISSLVGA